MKKLGWQALNFIFISGIGFFIDVIIYMTLSEVLKVDVVFANMISSLCSITFVFTVSTKKLFINNSKVSLKIKYILYIVYQIILICTISFFLGKIKLYLINTDIKYFIKYANICAKIIVTPITMTINFIVMKNIIEKI